MIEESSLKELVEAELNSAKERLEAAKIFLREAEILAKANIREYQTK